MACSSNLKQIGLAIASYESLHGMLPPGSSWGKSLFVNLLPHLEREDLSRRVDYADDHGAEFLQGVVIPTYDCPSDSAPRLIMSGGTPTAGTNYAASSGVWASDGKFNGLFRTLAEFWPFDYGPIRAADVTDGLSQTSAVAEILRSDASGRRLRAAWHLPKSYEPGEIEAFAAACRGLPAHPPASGWVGDLWGRGMPWHRANFAGTFYNHVLAPNEPSCLNQNTVPTAASTAGSGHAGGVNVLYGDGHVSFTDERIDLSVWRQLGSRNGQR
jgi:prepilin-type processing-associated H-X9-DG protein